MNPQTSNTISQNKAALPSIHSLLQAIEYDRGTENSYEQRAEIGEMPAKKNHKCNNSSDLSSSPISPDTMSRTASESLHEKNSDKKVIKKKTRTNLPKHVIDVLNEWLKTHLDNPYPTSLEKKDLISKTSLSNVQLSNWFINVRRRKLYSQYYDLKDKTDKSKSKKSCIHSASQSVLSSTMSHTSADTSTEAAHVTKDLSGTGDQESATISFASAESQHVNNVAEYLDTKKRMSLEHILNIEPSESHADPVPQPQRHAYVKKETISKYNNENKNVHHPPPTPIIITEADEIKLEEKFKFQPFIRRKKLMDRLYDLKKIYYVKDNEAGPEPLPEPDSDD